MFKRIRQYRNRKPAPAETSAELRWLLFAGMALSILGLGITAGILMLPFALIALVILWFGQKYAQEHCEAPKTWVKRIVFISINFTFLYMLVGIGIGLPYPQGQMAMLGMALISWEMFNRRNMYTGWMFVLANLHVTSTLSRGLFFLIPLLLVAGCFLMFLWVVERLDAAENDYLPVDLVDNEADYSRTVGGSLLQSAQMGWLVRFGLVAFLFAVGIFVLIPRFAGTPIVPPFTLRVPMRGGPQGQIINPAVPLVQVQGVNSDETGEYYHGFDSRLDLSYRGGLSTATMMYVRSPAKSYWRSHAYDFYDGRSWEQSAGDEVEIIDRRPGAVSFKLVADPPPGERFTQTFYVVRDLPNIAFVGGTPIEIFIPARQIAVDSTGGIRLGETLDAGLTYSVESVASRYEPGLLRLSSQNDPLDIRERYLQLPETVTQRTVELATELVQEADNRFDKAMAIQNHLLVTYPYDYFPPPQKPNSDSVDQFLFEDQTGYCEHYVSAMVVMLRSQGIPARLVAGFGSGRFDLVNNLYEVQAKDAHSWVEVYFPGYGWVPFEPTPGWVGTPEIGRINSWAFSGLAGAIDLPAIPFGAIASGAVTLFSVAFAPFLIIALLVGLVVGGRWLWQKYGDYLANRPRVYSKLAESESHSRGQVLTHYRKAQQQKRAMRDDEQTTQEHANQYAGFDELANLVDIAVYRPEPPTAEEIETGLKDLSERQ